MGVPLSAENNAAARFDKMLIKPLRRRVLIDSLADFLSSDSDAGAHDDL